MSKKLSGCRKRDPGLGRMRKKEGFDVRPIGLLLVAVALLIPFLWLPGIAQGRDGIALGSQYLGMAASQSGD